MRALLSLLPLCLALRPDDTFPSCLRAGQTWPATGILYVVINIPDPESCQEICRTSPSCAGVTWMSEAAVPDPLECFLFSHTTNDTVSCTGCISGPAKCSCNVQGECEVIGDNVLDMMSVHTVHDCEGRCSSFPNCTAYTYFGEESHFRHSCFLYSSCEVFANDCQFCTTGLSKCDICDFENTHLDGSCAAPVRPVRPVRPCEKGWAAFGNFCYLILNNDNQQYNNIDICKAECDVLGGTLGSIHSAEEDAFVYSLLRPARSGSMEQATFLGAELVSGTTYRWLDGSAWDYNPSWVPGYPYGRDCVYMGKYDDEWVDGICDHATPYWDCLCKKIQ